MEKARRIDSNSTWNNRAEMAIAHGALTNSKRPSCFVKGVYPTHLRRAQGAIVWDTDNKQYVDFICGLGSNILGYGNNEIAQAITERALKGATLSLGSETEILAAEKVKEVFPLIERLRFLKTGTDACISALKIARAYTGRDLVLSEGYHGWADDFVSLTPPALGVPKRSWMETLKPDLSNVTSDVGAVIIEPVQTDMSDGRRAWLYALQAKCKEVGAVLIFDEIITGFRTPKMGFTNYWGLEPDLMCLGKAIANGMPVSVVGGKKELMECGEYFISSTFAGETLSLAALIKTISLLQTKFNLDNLWEMGKRFISEVNSFHPERLQIEGYPSRGVFKGDELTRALFFQESVKAHLLFGPSFFFSFPHIALIPPCLSTIRDIMTRIKTGSVKLEGEMPRTPFAQKVRSK